MREAPVEDYLRDETKRRDGRAVKLSPLGWVGIPDRLVILPRGIIVFVELKRPKGGRVSKMQQGWHKWLRDRGHRVEVLTNKGEIDGFFKGIDARLAD